MSQLAPPPTPDVAEPISLRRNDPGDQRPASLPPSSPSTLVYVVITAVVFLAAGLLLAVLLSGSGDGISEEDVRAIVEEVVGTQVAAAQPVMVGEDGTVNQAQLQQMVNQAVSTQVAALVPTNTPIPPTPTPMPIAMTIDDDPFIGPENAPVTIVEFSDFQCSYCGRFYFTTLQDILAKYPNEVKFVYRDFVIFGEDSARAATASQCANEQGKFWDMHNMIFESRAQDTPPALSEDTLIGFANDLGLDTDSFAQCLTSGRYQQELDNDFNDAVAYGFRGTPGFVINGVVYPFGAQPFDVFDRIIQSELSRLQNGG